MTAAPKDTVCVIGAGSSGIVAVKELRARGIPVVCFERGSGVGGNWRYENDNGVSAAYESLHINTSKQRMAYSDFPMPEDYPEYPHHTLILRYFEAYVDHFGIRDAIRFRTSVTRVVRNDGLWAVTSTSPEGERTESYRAVVVANGHHWSQRWPAFAGGFAGTTLHSHTYKLADGFRGKRVLIVGIGNSAVDIACEVCRVAAVTTISTRRSAHVFPKYMFGRPTDHLITPTMSKLPLAIQEKITRALLMLARGPQERFGVPEPAHRLASAHPTISDELLHFVGHGRIAIRPDIERLDGDHVLFKGGVREPYDVIIYATGYDIAFPFLEETVRVEGNDVRLYRRVVSPEAPGLFFVGLIQPLGAVMPLAEAQSKWIAGVLAGAHRLPSREKMDREIESYRSRLRARYVESLRHTIQVDFFPYLAEIEKEMSRSRPND